MISKILSLIFALLALASSGACINRGDVPARGMAYATWGITVLGHPATCAQVGAASVSLLLDSRDGEDITSVFPCLDGQGVTPPVVAGPYNATLTLLSADGAAIATAPIQALVTIRTGQVAALAPVTFAASESGRLTLRIATIGTAANCLPRDQGGAGASAHLIVLQHATDGCAAVRLVRSRGNTEIGSYTINCSSPQVAACIERDETLTVDGIPSGPYAISVVARVGNSRCWAGTDTLAIPAGVSVVKSIQLAPETRPGC